MMRKFIPGVFLVAVVTAGVVLGVTISNYLIAYPSIYEVPISIVRDLRLASWARDMENRYPEYPLDLDAVYPGSALGPRWGIITNSPWLVEQTARIVPFFYMEHVAQQTFYPRFVAFQPNTSGRSFVVGGSASCEQKALVINTRMLQDDPVEDNALTFLVHELIHIQGGGYCDGPSEEIEARTTVATVETLAGMCNYGYEVACKAFYGEIKALALYSARATLMGYGKDWLYQLISNAFFREGFAEKRAARMYRFWNENTERKAELWGIISRYGAYPFRDMLMPGVCDGVPLETGIYGPPLPGTPNYLWTWNRMPFDDTALLLPSWAC